LTIASHRRLTDWQRPTGSRMLHHQQLPPQTNGPAVYHTQGGSYSSVSTQHETFSLCTNRRRKRTNHDSPREGVREATSSSWRHAVNPHLALYMVITAISEWLARYIQQVQAAHSFNVSSARIPVNNKQVWMSPISNMYVLPKMPL
jgi:hypothetical protein